MDVEEVSRRFGVGAGVWLAGLGARWGLEVGEVFASGGSSVVLRCRWGDGRRAVLKVSPDRALLGRQAEMLRVFGASGRVPAVLAVDAEVGAMVLEEVVPGAEAVDTPLLPGLWGDLLAALHAVKPPTRWPWDLRGRLDEAFVRIGKRLAEPEIGARVGLAAWERAARRCGELLDTQTRTVLLHGDLHLGNALDGGTRGLVAIDPKACVGDPCFDAVDYVVDGAGHDGVAARCERVASACGLDGDRLYAWSRVVAPMLVISYLTHGGPERAIDELIGLTAC
ncbi:aminoglycoside phosphotransferase family protein [Actinokineospora globicatena]|uniref:aminoglycoside phosphotransferase family protein n=1 Tax=Actinokineospora globicatena TaxID=103729 RepID=UPI0020A4E7DF|nr:aminoglycoside phosphotransferase family protein [Actinokineospora globicatena]GLW79298.1 aminoglycoside O-phosphotransferase [Actinokineospora globicatena]